MRTFIEEQWINWVDALAKDDYVCWLDRKLDVEMELVFLLFDELNAKLNCYCFLGIADFESHLAYYPKGTFYKKTYRSV